MMFHLFLSTVSCANDVDLGFLELSWLKIVFLGIVQGITELLPISSTAHLRIIPGLLGWQDPGSVFSAAMQLASIAAVIRQKMVKVLAVKPVNKINKYSCFCSDTYPRFALPCKFYVKIPETSI